MQSSSISLPPKATKVATNMELQVTFYKIVSQHLYLCGFSQFDPCNFVLFVAKVKISA